jgi:hypothetical protein
MSGATAFFPSEADQLEQLTEDLTMKEWNDVWDVYAERGYDSAALVAQKYKTAFKARYKVAPASDMPPPDVLAALAAAYQQAAGDWNQVKAALAQVSTPATKATKMSPMEAAVKAYLWDGR